MPEPATRSRTVLETSTSPGPACETIRAPMLTAMPPGFCPRSSHSPVCNPARISSPRSATASRTAIAQRIARAGPSKVAKNPSPAVSISRPEKWSSSLRTTAWCCSRNSAQRWSPSASARSVEPTMSVKRTVASTVSGSCAPEIFWMNPSSSSAAPGASHSELSSPASSTRVAPGMRSSMKRACSPIEP